MSEKANVVEFGFDVTCPYAWITSRWIKEVEKVRDVQVQFRPVSLSVLNEGRELDPEYQEKMAAGWFPSRVSLAIAKRHGNDKIDEYYTRVGTELHNNGRAEELETVITEVVNGLGLADAAEILELARTDEIDEDMRAANQDMISRVGDDVGTPIVSFGSTAFFGPVLTRIPRGEDAGEVFDGAIALAKFPNFYEIKRSRTTDPDPNA